MQFESVATKRAKTHTRYYSRDGSLLPGVTTILGILNKPALLSWSNKLGLAGIEVGKYVDILALVGTTAHEMILAHLKNEKFDPDGLPADIVDRAENALLSYFEWEKNHKIKPIYCEKAFVSEQLGFGGTIDFYGEIDGIVTLKDFKTSKAIYDEHLYQVAAYKILLVENDCKVDAVGILQIGRAENEGFSEKVITDCSKEFEIFRCCLEIYKLKKKHGR